MTGASTHRDSGFAGTRPSAGGNSGPISTLKRTFSSGGSTTTSSAASVAAAAAAAAQCSKGKLSPSAYDFDDISYDDDELMLLDLEGPSSTTTTKKLPSKSNTIASPPRAPKNPIVQMQSVSSMMMSQAVYIPPMPRLPATASDTNNNNNKENDATSREKSKSQSSSGWITAVKPSAPIPASLSAKVMQPPFTSKLNSVAKLGGSSSSVKSAGGKGQSSLSSFIVKGDSASDAESSFASTSSSSTGVGKKRSQPVPWDLEESTKPQKSARTDIKGKGKGGPGIGSLNVKQQIVLSAEQQKVLKMVVDEKKNVFFTGSAGTGKSILLREIIASLRRKYAGKGSDRVAVTASTGMAAANIGGTTIHSFAGIGLGQGTGEQLVDFVKKNRKAVGRWMRSEVLIIDEVSMVDGDLFDKLAHIAKRFRRKEGTPFGGIQLIMTGDFFQLPPVTKNGQPKFAFEAAAWKECIDVTVNLTKVFRQKDTEFIDMLNEMRFGTLTKESIVKFGKLKRQPKYEDGIEPTELFPLREQVDSSNRARLQALPGETYTYTALDEGEEPFEKMQKTLDNLMAPRTLTLKLDAQVMLLKNMDVGLVNGSVGKVVAFKAADEMDEEEADPDFWSEERLTAQHKLAGFRSGSVAPGGREGSAAPTAGSKQGSREPSAAPSEGGGGEAGKGKGPVKKAANPAAPEKVPIVAWKLPDGSIIKMRMQREEFKVEDNGDKVKARRKQFPMICAWAMSIHKSQGQTLERVKCDLGKIFEKGQAYVALSRATSLDGLQVLNFKPEKVMAHPKVVTWTKTLTTLS